MAGKERRRLHLPDRVGNQVTPFALRRRTDIVCLVLCAVGARHAVLLHPRLFRARQARGLNPYGEYL
jgi:hypothetical protein